MGAIELENPSSQRCPATHLPIAHQRHPGQPPAIGELDLGNIEGDAFGKVYEYFLGKFAIAEGAKGGEYFTPTPIVRLIVEIIEPFGGKILDPACGSGGMFVQSARFVDQHSKGKNAHLSIYGQDESKKHSTSAR